MSMKEDFLDAQQPWWARKRSCVHLSFKQLEQTYVHMSQAKCVSYDSRKTNTTSMQSRDSRIEDWWTINERVNKDQHIACK